MPVIECKFTPDGGSEFDVRNIEDFQVTFGREPAANGHIGMRGHRIGTVTIFRRKSLQNQGAAELESETIKLAAATEKKAYFKGELTIARDDDANRKVMTIRWNKGHICDMTSKASRDEITEEFKVCVTELTIDDVTIKRDLTV